MAQTQYTDGDRIPDKIILRAWPKMLFLWPSALAALASGIGTSLSGEMNIRWEFWGTLFLVVFALNLMIITFEFPRNDPRSDPRDFPAMATLWQRATSFSDL